MYTIPNTITWAGKCGLDLIGGVDTSGWTVTVPTGLHANGTTNDADHINTAITDASSNTIISIPAGTYLLTQDIVMKSNVVLRGAGSIYPFLPGGTGGTYLLNSGGSGHFVMGGSSPTRGSAVNISSGYTKGSSTLTLAAGHGILQNNYISIFQDNPAGIVEASKCDWCGEDSGQHCMQQFAKVTAVSGNDITIDPPMYYTYESGNDPEIKKMTFNIFNAGLENIKFSNVGGGGPQIYMRGAVNCWVKNVETYNAGNSAKQGHVQLEWCFANEITRSYFHGGRNFSSDRNYGVFSMFWNSAQKIESCILTQVRHAITFEGGGSGYAMLYNYGKDNYESEDTDALTESMTINHGPHPHMNLWEGNIDQRFVADYTMGSSSHNTLFRNWGMGYRSTPAFTYWEQGFNIGPWNRYFNLVGNVSGRSTWSSGTRVCSTSSECTEPIGYDFNHYDDGSAPDGTNPYSTAFMNGNYDYVGDGILTWAGADHTLDNSLYYASKPSFFGGLTWPNIDPNTPTIGDNPAKGFYDTGEWADETGTEGDMHVNIRSPKMSTNPMKTIHRKH